MRIELNLGQDLFQSLDLPSERNEKLKFINNEPDIEIPLGMLGPENPILQSGEVVLWEDELADRGSSKCYVRYRVMADCWFVLLRSYIRLDKVAIRIMDTRVFHKFGTDELIRDFLVKEESWQTIADGGFIFDSEWLLSHHQSD